MRRVYFDKGSKKITVAKNIVVQEVELDINSRELGIETEEELQELIKSVGGVNKFKKHVQEKLIELRERDRR